MTSRLSRLVGPALAVALLLCAAVGYAGPQARIQGTTKDAQGNKIPDVKITITTKAISKFKLDLKSDKDGHWGTILNDATMKYVYRFEKPGYLPFEEEKKIGIGTNETWDIVLMTEDQAIKAGKIEVKVDPFVEAFNGSIELFKADDLPGAQAKAEEAIRLGPDKSNAYDLGAKIAHGLKNWDKAIEYGEKSLALEADNASLFPVLADAYRAKGDKAKTAEYEKKFAAANPDNPDILYNEAVELYNKNDFKGAEPILRKVVEVKPDHAKAHYLLGMTCVNLNKIPDMKKHLTEYLKLEPKGADAGTAREMLDAFK